MKKVLTIVLIFAVILAALLGLSSLWQRIRPAPAEPVEPEKETVIANTIDPNGATVIALSDSGVSVTGMGAEAPDGHTVTIAYPGTYRVQGEISDGQLVVDLKDFSGGVYLILDGASVSCDDGPAIHIVQADLTVVYLAEGTENLLRDGADYLVQEGQEKKTGAGIYSADDLLITGEGALTVVGSAADGIRSKDALAIQGGDITVYAADDGLQASDFISVSGGAVAIGAYGDGISTTDGYVEISGGDLRIVSGGDGVDAVTALDISDGSVSVTAHGGPESFPEIAAADISAKGLKAENITITGGEITLSTADDGIHGGRDVTVTGGSFTIASGDDAVHAAGVLEVKGVTIDISESYEALEGDTVRLSEVTVSAAAENNGVDAGEGGVTAYASDLTLKAPRAMSSDGVMNMLAGSVFADADGTDSLFSFTSSELIGCTVLIGTDSGRSDVLLEKGRLPGSMLFGFSEAIPAGTPFSIAEPSGNVVYFFTLDKDVMEVYLALGGLLDGQTYTLTVGENVMEFTYDAEDCVVSEQELPITERGGFPGGPGGFPGMPGGRR